MKKRWIVLLVLGLLPVGFVFAIDWIQSNERVVGEGSPLYTDVVNRPAKQIWAHYTSEHTTTGTHKNWIFPTPIPTATPQPTPTPIPSNALIDWTNATANFKTTGIADISGQPVMLKTFVLYPPYDVAPPDIPENTSAIWKDGYTNAIYWLVDVAGGQYQVQLPVAPTPQPTPTP